MITKLNMTYVKKTVTLDKITVGQFFEMGGELFILLCKEYLECNLNYRPCLNMSTSTIRNYHEVTIVVPAESAEINVKF